MATIVLASLGASLGAGLGGTIAGVALGPIAGQVAGGLAGQAIDGLLFGGGSSPQAIVGPRLQSLDVTTAQEGTPIPDVEGRARVPGHVIWATRYEEVETTEDVGGKGAPPSQSVTSYEYFANFAVAFAQGPVRHVGRIWADGELLDPSEVKVRVRRGFNGDGQDVDSLIEGLDGDAPAYRGTAYAVFERLPIAGYGNRVPQLAFEVYGKTGEVEDLIEGVCMLPGSTEFGYMPEPVTKTDVDALGEPIFEAPENANRFPTTSDWTLSLDLLQGVLTETGSVLLVVAWFGDDLRCGLCNIEPRVEIAEKATAPYQWAAGGRVRSTAKVVSEVEGRPAFGSSPDDLSVVRAIKDLKARGLKVVLYPFIMMDIPADTTKNHPWGPPSTQPPYPWRGRMRPRPDRVVGTEVDDFAGNAAPSDFAVSGETVTYSGTASDWGYRRFILHLAHLAKAAGGVHGFMVGTEMRGMTTATPGGGSYPFVDLLCDLADDVAGILPSATISYAADWSEYHSHRPDDGSGDVYFHLDKLWSRASVGAVCIDAYFPLSDWRDGSDHLDAQAGWASIYDLDYLKSNVEGGEGWAWFYASDADRASQTRTPIADTAHGEDWVFRQKAVRDWHANAHRNRPGGVRNNGSTSWVPGSKPIWFTEYGCPAVDKGPNQPNVFPDSLSSEGAVPHWSAGTRDDFAQRQYNRAILEWWRDNGSGVMNLRDMYAWAWDARPWPEFPSASDVWTDSPNWSLGHWLQGRVGTAPVEAAARRRLADHGFPSAAIDVSEAYGQVDGYAPAEALGLREWMQPLELVLRLDAYEDDGVLSIRARGAAPVTAEITPDDMVEDGPGPRFAAIRAALTDRPTSAVIRFRDSLADYETTAARAVISEEPFADAGGLALADSPLVMDFAQGMVAAERWLRGADSARDRISFAVPPSLHVLRPGAVVPVRLPGADVATPYLIRKVTEGEARKIEAEEFDGAALSPVAGPPRLAPAVIKPRQRRLGAAFLDLPLLADSTADDHLGFVAFHGDPWPGGADLYRSTDEATGFVGNAVAGLRGGLGQTVADLPPGRLGVWSPEAMDVEFFSAVPVSRPEGDVLAGANAIALHHPSGWEVIQFRDAELIGADTWRLTGLLRGQRGTEFVRHASGRVAGARVVALDAGVIPVDMTPGQIGRSYWWKWGPAGEDPAGTNFRTRAHAFAGVGRRPFAPAQFEARPDGVGGWSLSWVRRSRIDGDGWGGEVPLGETEERYRVQIGPEADPLRSKFTGETSWTWTAADIAADGAAGTVSVRVAQKSETWGWGPAATLTVEV
ncbi:MAG: glycoside hydrolase/phage tail family protein [Pseudomonadota bacterium]